MLIRPLLIGFAVVTASTTLAQTADPFGGGNRGNQAAPSAAASDDPFAADPFAADPFSAEPRRGQSRTKNAALAGKAVQQQQKSKPPLSADEAEERIQHKLGKETSMTAVSLPLVEFFHQLSSMHEIPIVVDRRALEEIGLSAEEPVTISLNNVSLRSLLRLALREFDLTYMIKDEVLQITTIESAEQNLIVRAYTIPGIFVPKADDLVKALQTTVIPEAWDLIGGPSRAAVVENVLVVAGTDYLHDETADFLKMVEEASGKHPKETFRAN